MLLREFPNLKEKLLELRQKEMPLVEIANYFTGLGYRCDRKTVSRACKKHSIFIGRRSYVGSKNPFYSKKHTDETKNKSSLIHKTMGYAKGKNNFFYGKRGEHSQNWKGGTSTKRAILYASDEWKNLRLRVFTRDVFTCQWCGFIPTKERNRLNAHHIIPLHMDWSLSLDINNLITLCTDCHKKTFNREKELIPFFQDIVRTSGRPEEENRNDFPQLNVE